jgi:glycosyltransferase involved in cell wall biosynthesis
MPETQRAMSNNAIIAILKDEMQYLPEWISWHRLAGVDKFLLADNGSIDGTREYLEALTDAGIADIVYQGKTRNAQTLAYHALLDTYGKSYQYVAFIDADEFLVADGTGRAMDQVCDIFTRYEDCGALALNWRQFGSGGQLHNSQRPVLERFTECTGENNGRNLYCKTIASPRAINEAKIHHCELREGYRYYNGRGEALSFRNLIGKHVNHPTGVTGQLCAGPLRINHYIVKSLEEYENRKRRKGDAVLGPDHDRTMQYFHDNDLNHVHREMSHASIAALVAEIARLESLLESCSRYTVSHCGELLDCTTRRVTGWCKAADNVAPTLMVTVNGDIVGQVFANCSLGDYQEAANRNGFSFEFESELSPTDTVSVTVRGNQHRLDRDTQQPRQA